ncbi:MAG: hypothetical protein RL235_52 [Chlamydiota bacterium]|jgi:glycosyltransferase involved in cell wall biosynthesis
MRILHLEASPGWGGQEMRILVEAVGMRDRGHTIVFGVMKGGSLIGRAQDKGFTVHSLRFHKKWWFLTFFQILWMIRRYRIDLVNTHSSLDSWIGGIAARLAGCSIIRTRHLSTPVKQGLNSRLLYGWLADFVVTTCISIIAPLAESSKKHISLFRSVPTGVDPERIVWRPEAAADFRRSLTLSPGDCLVGCVCFMRSWKGIDDFLQAAHILRHEPGLKWVLIGGGHEATYRAIAKEKQLDGIVHFTGHLENPFHAIAALDIFVLLSTANEGVSQAMLQAAYLGKPLISTETGGLKDVCIHGQTGLIVAPRSSDEVAAAVRQLQQDKTLRHKLGEGAAHFVRKSFLWTQTLDAMESISKNTKSLS